MRFYRILLACVLTGLGSPALLAQTAVKVGISVPLKGVQAEAGKEIVSAWQAFAKYATTQKLFGSRELRLQVLDDAFDPAKSKANAEKFVADDVAVVVNPLGIPTTLAMAKVLEPARIPLLAPISGSSMLYGKSSDVFHIKASFETEIEQAARVFTSMKARKIAIITDDVSDRQQLVEKFRQTLTQHGNGETSLVKVSVVAQKDGKIDAAVAEAMAANPDTIYVMTIPGLAGGIMKTLKERGYSARLAAWSVAAVEQVFTLLGPLAAGTIFSTTLPAPNRQKHQLIRNFRSFAAEQGIAPSYRALEIFVTGMVLSKALAKAPGRVVGNTVWDGLAGLGQVDLGGYWVEFSANKREGSTRVDVMFLDAHGKFL